MTPTANVADLGNQINNFLPPKTNKVTENQPSKLELLSQQLQIHKAKKSALNIKIKDLEDEVVMLCGHKSEGVSKFTSENYKISTTGKINRKIIDHESLIALAKDIVVIKYSLDMSEYNRIAKTNPAMMQRILQCIESKEAKTAVAIYPTNEG